MKLRATPYPIASAIKPDHWAGNFISDQLFLLAEVTGPESEKNGKKFLEEVHLYFLSHRPRTLEAFKRMLRISLKGHPRISCVAGLLVDTVLYAWVERAGAIYLSRQNQHGILLASPGSISGTLKSGDRLFFASNGVGLVLPKKDIFGPLALSSGAEVAKEYQKRLGMQDVTAVGLVLDIHRATPQVPLTAPFQSITPTHRMQSTVARVWSRLPRRKQLRPLLVVITLLIVLLVISVMFGIRQREKAQVAARITDVLATVSHQFDEGMALIDLNPIRARELLTGAKTTLEGELRPGVSQSERKELETFLKKITTGLETAQREYLVIPTSFFDLSLLKSGGQGSKMALYQDALIITDTVNKSLYRVSIGSKSSRILAGGDSLALSLAVAVYGEEVYIFADGIKRVALSEDNLPDVIPKDPEWGRVTDMKMFGGNIYLLDSGKNWIWKYLRTDTGFSSRQDYFVFDTLVDMQSASSMAIDGTVWVVDKGKIMHFVQGKESEWKIIGLTEPLGEKLAVFTDEATANVYVFDSQNRRVIVVDKTGTYLAQYQWKEPFEISDFVVSEVIKKILLLSRGTIYGIELK